MKKVKHTVTYRLVAIIEVPVVADSLEDAMVVEDQGELIAALDKCGVICDSEVKIIGVATGDWI